MRVVHLRAEQPKPKPVEFQVGQRVRVSRAGEEGMNIMARTARTGVVVKPKEAYPGSVSVLRDGSKSALSYHPSYWEPE